MSIEEVLRATVMILKSINVPVGLAEQIAIPLMHAANNIDQCISVLSKDGDGQQDEERKVYIMEPQVDTEVEEIEPAKSQ